jgi:hypothetical protein
MARSKDRYANDRQTLDSKQWTGIAERTSLREKGTVSRFKRGRVECKVTLWWMLSKEINNGNGINFIG